MKVNSEIKSNKVLLIDENGNNIGTIPTYEALRKAKDVGLDLVEVSANTAIPVCKLMDFGKYKYDQTKNIKKNRGHSKQLKEIRFRPTTNANDLLHKARHALEFLKDGHKVKISIVFKGREMEHLMEIGQVAMVKFLESVDFSKHIPNDQKASVENGAIVFYLTPSE